MPQHLRRLRILLPALVLLALALPSVASAQATRTWVSGVGDDVNPCSRTAPCKTFAGAISKTAAGGIINAMDDGGFGTLTITKPITVDGGHHTAGVLSSGGINGIIVNIDPAIQPANFVNNGRVVLKNLRLEGNVSIPTAGGFTPGLNGVRILNARNVKVVNSDIGLYSRSGVVVEPAANQTSKVQVIDSFIHDNGGGGVTASPANGATANVVVRGSALGDNGCGIVAGAFGMTNVFTSSCGTATLGASTGTVRVNAFDNEVSGNSAFGVLSRGASSTVRMGGNTITMNTSGGLSTLESGGLLSFGNNVISGNFGPDGAPTSAVIPLAKRGH
jgi:hypothetical protein